MHVLLIPRIHGHRWERVQLILKKQQWKYRVPRRGLVIDLLHVGCAGNSRSLCTAPASLCSTSFQ